MKNKNYTIIITQDEGGMYIADVPDLPGCHTQGKSLDQLMARIKEAIELYLEVLKGKKQKPNNLAFIGVQQLEVNT